MKIKIVAFNIAKMLPNGPNMLDFLLKTSLVMMAEPEEFAETEKGKNRVRSEVTGDPDYEKYHLSSYKSLIIFR